MGWPKHPRVTQVSQLCPSCDPVGTVLLWGMFIECSPVHSVCTGLLENPEWAGYSWDSPQAKRGKGPGKAGGAEKLRGCLSWAGGVRRKRI